MQIIEKSPCVPLKDTRWFDSRREADMDRQVSETILAMIADNPDFFIGASMGLADEVDSKIDKIDELIAKEGIFFQATLVAQAENQMSETEANSILEQTEQNIENLQLRRRAQEARRRSADELAEETWKRLKAEAVSVLEKSHAKRMAARLAEWLTTCRFGDCPKKPRSGSTRNGMNNVFCPGHAGTRSQISKADYRRLQANPNLRVIVA